MWSYTHTHTLKAECATTKKVRSTRLKSTTESSKIPKCSPTKTLVKFVIPLNWGKLRCRLTCHLCSNHIQGYFRDSIWLHKIDKQCRLNDNSQTSSTTRRVMYQDQKHQRFILQTASRDPNKVLILRSWHKPSASINSACVSQHIKQ